MIRSRRLKSVSVVANLALCLVLAFSFAPLGLASQPDNGDENRVYLPLMLRRPVPFIESTGILDPSFDGDGWISIDFGASDVAIQADGKIVVVGSGVIIEPCADIIVARFNPDGSPDTTFDGDGKVVTDFAGDDDYGNAVAIQADGKIVVAARSYDDFVVVRYNPDGSLDASFSDDGYLVTDLAGSTDIIYAVTLQADSKIVVAGRAYTGSNTYFALARYNPDGSLDTSFSDDGKLVTNIIGIAYAVEVQRLDGKIVVAGEYGGNLDFPDFAVARYNPDGSPDTTFDIDGVVLTDFAGSYDSASVIALQDDGKIVIAGCAREWAQEEDFAVARYNPDGSLDVSFSDDGKLLTDLGYSDYGTDIVLQPNGKIIVAGAAIEEFIGYFALVRYNPDGSRDASFSEDGILVSDITGFRQAVALQPDGRIVMVGYQAVARFQ